MVITSMALLWLFRLDSIPFRHRLKWFTSRSSDRRNSSSSSSFGSYVLNRKKKERDRPSLIYIFISSILFLCSASDDTGAIKVATELHRKNENGRHSEEKKNIDPSGNENQLYM